MKNYSNMAFLVLVVIMMVAVLRLVIEDIFKKK